MQLVSYEFEYFYHCIVTSENDLFIEKYSQKIKSSNENDFRLFFLPSYCHSMNSGSFRIPPFLLASVRMLIFILFTNFVKIQNMFFVKPCGEQPLCINVMLGRRKVGKLRGQVIMYLDKDL